MLEGWSWVGGVEGVRGKIQWIFRGEGGGEGRDSFRRIFPEINRGIL